MIASVQAQTYERWELCMADGSDGDHQDVGRICQEYAAADSRIKYRKIERNLGISGNTNVCFEMATGEYIGLFDHDDLLHPSVLYEYMKVICEQGADYIYCDEVTFEGDSIDNMLTIHFKPDFSIDNLRANNYICHFSVFSEKLLEESGLFRSEYDGSQDHDMILRLTARAKKIVHVPKILYYWRSHPASVAADIGAKTYAIDAAKRAVLAHLKSCGLEGSVESTRAFPTIFRIKYKIKGRPKISIIIPNRDHVDDLKRCVDSILNKSTYENYEILVVENNSEKPETFEYYRLLESQPKVRVLTYKEAGGFNYSRINNFAAREADGEYLLLLNNDTKVITREWMEELLMYAQREDVGAVGAKLYYSDNTIQHAGIVIGLGAHRSAGHTHHLLPRENLGYMGRLCYAQDVSAVTGACLMVRKEIYDGWAGWTRALPWRSTTWISACGCGAWGFSTCSRLSRSSTTTSPSPGGWTRTGRARSGTSGRWLLSGSGGRRSWRRATPISTPIFLWITPPMSCGCPGRQGRGGASGWRCRSQT